jgi:hypothetical protein
MIVAKCRNLKDMLSQQKLLVIIKGRLVNLRIKTMNLQKP